MLGLLDTATCSPEISTDVFLNKIEPKVKKVKTHGGGAAGGCEALDGGACIFLMITQQEYLEIRTWKMRREERRYILE